MGLQPLKMMDRDFRNELPSCQVRKSLFVCTCNPQMSNVQGNAQTRVIHSSNLWFLSAPHLYSAHADWISEEHHFSLL